MNEKNGGQFYFFTEGKQHKTCELDMITSDLECPWHDYCLICSYDVMGTDFENSLYFFSQSEKLESFCQNGGKTTKTLGGAHGQTKSPDISL